LEVSLLCHRFLHNTQLPLMKHLAFASALCAFLLAGLAQKLAAQCAPQILNCPPAPLVEVCDTSDNSPQFWNALHWPNWETGGSNLADAPADLSISARDTCGNALTVSYLLFLDLDNNGQQETVVSSQQAPPAGAVYFGNAANPNFAGGQYRLFDQRPVASFFRYRFALETKVAGGVTTARVRWRTAASVLGGVPPQLPYGTHRIRWTVRNAVGQEAVCEYWVVVRDCGAPRVVCKNGVSVHVDKCGAALVWGGDILESTEDNYEGKNQSAIAVREANTGVGFPLNTYGGPQTGVILGCQKLGDRQMELWTRDKAGNTNKCLVAVNIADTSKTCPLPVTRVCLERWCDGGKVKHGFITAGGSSAGIPFFTATQTADSSGCTILRKCKASLPDVTTITPVSDFYPLEGVDQADLDRLQRHVDGTEPFTETWQYIAADVNKSGSITSFDRTELEKLVNGTYTELPNNTSWRFIDRSFVFPDPLNPFKTAFPENVTVNNQKSDTTVILLGIKIGDLDCSLNFTSPSEDRFRPTVQTAESQTLVAYPYPNPATDGTTFFLKMPEAAAATLALCDLAGRELWRHDFFGEAGENRVAVPASVLPQAGLYLWRVSAGEQVRTGKLAKQ